MKRSIGLDTLTLADDCAEAIVVPSLGGGLAAYDLVLGEQRQALFRRCKALADAGPFDLACNLLVPWSNRVSGGGFHFGGEFHALAPNLAGEAFPIHGNGFSSPWSVTKSTKSSAELEFVSEGPGPYRYRATVSYALRGGGYLAMVLKVTNLGTVLPFGLGLHPWLPRTPQTFLQANAANVTLQNPSYLPAGTVSVAQRPRWNFSNARALPEGWINNDFDGWNGHACIEWRDRGLAIEIAATGASRYIVYSPAADAGFFCFEPVSHAVDAFNLRGEPEQHGLVVLDRDQSMELSCEFIAHVL